MISQSDAPFPVTRWSLVAGARAAADPKRKRAALEDLCGLYWRPIYGFLRRRGLAVAEAQDAAQGFFLSLLEEDLFAKAQAGTGRMRSFLLGALQRWQRGEWRKGMAEKRGGGNELFSLDVMAEEDGFEVAGADDDTPERHFEKSCALALLEAAMRRLAQEQSAAGKGQVFDTLRPLLAPLSGEAAITQEEAARHLRLTPEALRVTLHRLRKRFAEVLRETVADTL
ncbi:MAG: sigma-70 family RNA polymerase sigma factor, partial [Verrucomicrobiaceae bacterium]|nr:sigma-70 family RNA polymerase sigma factor [Verrucomicrobiaceae bacterium]